MARPTKEEWAAIRDNANHVLDDNSTIVQAFRSKAREMFAPMIAEKEQPFKRRPPVGLRLICAGEPPAKLIVHPGWSNHTKEVVPHFLELELFQEVTCKVG